MGFLPTPNVQGILKLYSGRTVSFLQTRFVERHSIEVQDTFHMCREDSPFHFVFYDGTQPTS